MRIVLFLILISFHLIAQTELLQINNTLKQQLTQEELNYIQKKKVIIASNEFDYEPMDFNVDGIPIGYSIDLLNILAEELGLAVQYHTRTWTTLLNDLATKKIDLMHTIYKTPQREKSMYFSLPYLISNNYFITRKNEVPINNIKDLFGKKIGVSKGWLEETIVNKYPQIQKVYYPGLKEKLEALSLGQIDVIMNDKNIANYYIKKYGYTDIQVTNRVQERKDGQLDKYHFATLKEESILITLLNKAYTNLDINLLDKLQNKWFGNIIDRQSSIFNIEELKYLSNKKALKLCIVSDLIPLSHMEEDQPQGIISDILFELDKQLNIPMQFIKTKNYKESVRLFKDKKCEVLPLIEYSKKLESTNITKPYLNISYVAIGKNNQAFFSDISELKNKKVSIAEGTLKLDEVKKKYSNIEVINVKDIEEGLELVSTNQVYMHLAMYPVAKYYIAKNGSEKFDIIGRLINTLPLSMSVLEEDILLNSIIQKSVSALSKTKIDTLVNNWTEVKVKRVVNYELLYKLLIAVIILALLGIWRYKVLKNKNEEIHRINQALYESKQSLIKQKEEFESVFRYSKDGIAIIDFDYKVIDCNQAFEAMLSFSKKEVLSKDFLEMIVDIHKEEMKNVFKMIRKEGTLDLFEKECIGQDGKIVSTNMTFSILPQKSKLLLTVKDLTSLKLLESQSKLASMGEMIGNIAHQWRQPLSIITTSATGMSLKADMQEKVANQEIIEFSEEIVNQAEYLSKTIDDFRDFIKENNQFIPMSVKASAKSALSLTQASLKANYITIVDNIKEDLIIKGNKNEITQALINIINNAKDKLKELDDAPFEKYIFISTQLLDSKSIELRIVDTGGGIEDKVINKIFEPYFTTKHQSVGTGLGLSMTDKIIRQRHEGMIQVYNKTYEYKGKQYKGACFVIRLYA